MLYNSEEDSFLLDLRLEQPQEDNAPQLPRPEDLEDDFYNLSDIYSSYSYSPAIEEDNAEQERREIARIALSGAIDELDLTSMIGSEDGPKSDEDLTQDHEAEEQLLRELDQSLEPKDAEPNFPLELGLHLLDFHGCDEGSHEQNYQEHLIASAYPDSHYSLEDVTRIIGRLPDVITNQKLMNPSF
jgi:hypothetical protein